MASANVTDVLPLTWAAADFALSGGCSGDLCVARVWTQGALLAVIDGIGHGKEAYEAAACARAVLEAHCGEPLQELVRRCHEALRGTRGVVMSLVSFDAPAGSISWLGVGNVRVLLLRRGVPAPEELMLRPGVVGAQLPRLAPATLPAGPGDTLVFATDGIRNDFANRTSPVVEPGVLARGILANHCLESDDALVLVARIS